MRKTDAVGLLLLSWVLMCGSVMAQQKSFTLDDLLRGGSNFSKMQPRNMNLRWWGNNLVKEEDGVCYIYNGEGSWKTLFSLEDLKKVCSGITSLENVSFPDISAPLAAVSNGESSVLYDWKQRRIVQTVSLEGKSWVDYAPKRHRVAYNEKDNLYVEEPGREKIQISRDGSHDIVYGQSVHRDEFGISKGTFWSSDGMSLCFYRMDQSMVADYPLVDISARIAALQPIKYPMAGCASHKVSVGVFHVQSRQTVWLDLGDTTDQYYSGITWSPDSRKIFLYNLNRGQNHLRLLQFDARTGKREAVLYEETHPKYVHPKHGLSFLPWDSDKFVYCSEKDGFQHLYLYSLKKKETVRKITERCAGVVVDLLGYNEEEKSVVFTGTGLSPIQHNLFSVSIETGKPKVLGSSEGVHYGKLSADGSSLIDIWSSPSVRRKIDLIHVKKGKTVSLLTAEDPWRDYNVPEITSGTIKAADGSTDLYYRLVKPVDFDPRKKYPAIVYVYGGPNVRMVEASFGYMYRGWELYMAQKGYVVFALDSRGSDERGLEFENVTFRRLGEEEMKDQLKGVDFLKSLPYVDAARLGVHGWSYGGFMATNLMLTYPDVFKVGVAGGPVINWNYYEVMYGERYMDTPQDNPEGYKNSNLCLKAGQLGGKLLMIFGYNDPVCVPQHTLSFLRACADAGTHPDLFVYSGDGHNMTGHDQVHLHEHITQYFEDYLK